MEPALAGGILVGGLCCLLSLLLLAVLVALLMRRKGEVAPAQARKAGAKAADELMR